MSEKKFERPQPPVSQETVDMLCKTKTMEEFLSVATAEGIVWEELPDEWLDAIAQGDVTDLMYQMKHKPKTGKRKGQRSF